MSQSPEKSKTPPSSDPSASKASRLKLQAAKDFWWLPGASADSESSGQAASDPDPEDAPANLSTKLKPSDSQETTESSELDSASGLERRKDDQRELSFESEWSIDELDTLDLDITGLQARAEHLLQLLSRRSLEASLSSVRSVQSLRDDIDDSRSDTSRKTNQSSRGFDTDSPFRQEHKLRAWSMLGLDKTGNQPEEDILYQWRLRRGMEQARQTIQPGRTVSALVSPSASPTHGIQHFVLRDSAPEMCTCQNKTDLGIKQSDKKSSKLKRSDDGPDKFKKKEEKIGQQTIDVKVYSPEDDVIESSNIIKGSLEIKSFSRSSSHSEIEFKEGSTQTELPSDVKKESVPTKPVESTMKMAKKKRTEENRPSVGTQTERIQRPSLTKSFATDCDIIVLDNEHPGISEQESLDKDTWILVDDPFSPHTAQEMSADVRSMDSESVYLSPLQERRVRLLTGPESWDSALEFLPARSPDAISMHTALDSTSPSLDRKAKLVSPEAWDSPPEDMDPLEHITIPHEIPKPQKTHSLESDYQKTRSKVPSPSREPIPSTSKTELKRGSLKRPPERKEKSLECNLPSTPYTSDKKQTFSITKETRSSSHKRQDSLPRQKRIREQDVCIIDHESETLVVTHTSRPREVASMKQKNKPMLNRSRTPSKKESVDESSMSNESFVIQTSSGKGNTGQKKFETVFPAKIETVFPAKVEAVFAVRENNNILTKPCSPTRGLRIDSVVIETPKSKEAENFFKDDGKLEAVIYHATRSRGVSPVGPRVETVFPAKENKTPFTKPCTPPDEEEDIRIRGITPVTQKVETVFPARGSVTPLTKLYTPSGEEILEITPATRPRGVLGGRLVLPVRQTKAAPAKPSRKSKQSPRSAVLHSTIQQLFAGDVGPRSPTMEIVGSHNTLAPRKAMPLWHTKDIPVSSDEGEFPGDEFLQVLRRQRAKCEEQLHLIDRLMIALQ